MAKYLATVLKRFFFDMPSRFRFELYKNVTGVKAKAYYHPPGSHLGGRMPKSN